MDTCNAVTKFEPSHLASEQLDSFVSSYDTSPIAASSDDSLPDVQKLTLIRGVPGSGKTTFANTLTATVVVEADQYFTDKDGAYQYENHRIKEAHNWCQLETKRLLKAGYNVAVANTFVKNWEMKFYKSLADDMGLAFEIIEMTGNYQNVHGVPDAIVKRMASQFETLAPSFSVVKRMAKGGLV